MSVKRRALVTPSQYMYRSFAKKAKIYRAPSSKKFLLGNKVTTTLKYVHIGQLNPGAVGVPATYVFTANGLFDPDITSGGHQPRGFDELKNLFDHYYVTSSTIKLSVMASTAQAGAICGISLQDDATPEADMITAMENRICSYKPLAYGNGSITVNLGFNSKSFFDINDRQLYGTSSSNPSDQAYYVVFAQPTYATDLAAIDFMVEIQYTVTFSEPNNIAQS